jgi:hypothetical protein
MSSTASSFAVAFIAAALWLVWNVEHEHTNIRAPWTGATYIASLCGFVAAGYLGRGWRALLIGSFAAAAAILLVDPLVWHSSHGDPVELTSTHECDPGCVSTEAAAIMAAVGASLLATLGIFLRRAVGRVRRSTAAA